MSSSSTGRPLRRDAAENRERLLDAADRVFGEHGLEASVDEVAKLAGVGMGTLYRRFPTKQALIDELVGGLRRDLLSVARASEVAPDGIGLEQLVVATCELQAARPGCLPLLWDHSDAELSALQEYRQIARRVLNTAQEAGRIRPDVTSTDIAMVLWSARGVIATTVATAPRAWRRHLELLLAGLRPADFAGSGQLREQPLTDEQAHRIMVGRRQLPD